jgi:hypothetical protein
MGALFALGMATFVGYLVARYGWNILPPVTPT